MINLNIVTRCRYPSLHPQSKELARCIASVENEMTDDLAIFGTVIYDDSVAGRGLHASNRVLATFTPRDDAHYVMALDDDDEMPAGAGARILAAINAVATADIIRFRADCLGRGVLPDADAWMVTPPVRRQTPGTSFISTRETWMKYREAWDAPSEADWRYVSACVAGGAKQAWHWGVIAKCQKISHGRR